jgi:hypothetical protein
MHEKNSKAWLLYKKPKSRIENNGEVINDNNCHFMKSKQALNTTEMEINH